MRFKAGPAPGLNRMVMIIGNGSTNNQATFLSPPTIILPGKIIFIREVWVLLSPLRKHFVEPEIISASDKLLAPL
jgi:hypothetical protein